MFIQKYLRSVIADEHESCRISQDLTECLGDTLTMLLHGKGEGFPKPLEVGLSLLYKHRNRGCEGDPIRLGGNEADN